MVIFFFVFIIDSESVQKEGTDMPSW